MGHGVSWRRFPALAALWRGLEGTKRPLAVAGIAPAAAQSEVGPQFLLGGAEQPLLQASLQLWHQQQAPSGDSRDRPSPGCGGAAGTAPAGGSRAERGMLGQGGRAGTPLPTSPHLLPDISLQAGPPRGPHWLLQRENCSMGAACLWSPGRYLLTQPWLPCLGHPWVRPASGSSGGADRWWGCRSHPLPRCPATGRQLPPTPCAESGTAENVSLSFFLGLKQRGCGLAAPGTHNPSPHGLLLAHPTGLEASWAGWGPGPGCQRGARGMDAGGVPEGCRSLPRPVAPPGRSSGCRPGPQAAVRSR